MAFDDLSTTGRNGTSTATKVAAQTTQNGWPIDGPLKTWTVPGVTPAKQLTLTSNEDAACILLFVAEQWHKFIGPINRSSGDTGGYDKRPIGGLGGATSNHRSGTAVDHTWNDYPQGSNRMTNDKKAVLQRLNTDLEGVWRWGGNYTGTLDQHHGEINVGPTNPKLRTIADKIRSGRMAKTAQVAPVTTTAAQYAALSTTQKANTVSTTKAVSTTTPAEVLPAIGSTAQQPIIPLTYARLYSLDNRLGDILVAGKQMQGNVSAAVLSCTMSYSTTQVGQLTLVLADSPDASLFADDVFAEGTAVDFGDQHLDVRGLGIAPGGGAPRLTVNARSRLISHLRSAEHTGKGSWGSRDVSQWAVDIITKAGGYPVVQPGLGTQTISRQASGSTPETTWGVIARLAQALGCWAYEFEQIVTLAKPSWLAARQSVRTWEITWLGYDNYSPGLVGMPAFTMSYDGDSGQQLTFQLTSADAYLARPGDKARLMGRLGRANGEWIVTSVAVPTKLTEPVSFTCARITDPTVTVVATS